MSICIYGKNRISIVWVLVAALFLVMLWINPVYADAEVNVPIRVSMTGNSLPTELFTVQLRENDTGATKNGEVELSAEKKSEEVIINLGNLAEGVYSYEIKLIAGSNPDITYSDKVYRYYVIVKSDGSVEQKAVNKADENDKPERIEFINNYRKSSSDEVIGDPPVRIKKDISGKKPPAADKFIFVMVPEDPNYPLPDVATQGSGVARDGYVEVYLNGIGEVEIGNITFREEGVYRYFVHEKDTAIDGYNYDDARFTVVYNVSRDQDGALSCARTILRDEKEVVTDCNFDNIYDPNPVTRTIRRGVKTGDPAIMWPLTALCVACMVIIALILDRRNREEAERGRK